MNNLPTTNAILSVIRSLWPSPRMNSKQQLIFIKRLAILIKAEIPILAALAMLKQQAVSKSSIQIIGSLYNGVEKGRPLSGCLADFTKVFKNFSVNIVRVGEISGTLGENLTYLAEELKKQQELKQKLIGALIYPSIIVFATLAISILLTVYVFPKIMPVFLSFKFQLPWSTRLLITISFFMQHYWFWVLLGLAVIILAVIILQKNLKIKIWFHKNALKIPLLGEMLSSYEISSFTRTLGLLLKSDVKILEALGIVSNTVSNEAYRQKFLEISEYASKGQKYHAVWRQIRFFSQTLFAK